MTQAAPLLDARSIGVRGDRGWILGDVSFEVRSREITAVIGPNGAGKTTLLEVLTGLRRPERGELLTEGQPLGRFTEFARRFAFLPDAGELPSEATVRTLVADALTLGARAPSLVEALRRALKIEPLLDAPAGRLSRGEKQRVSLFCTLLLARAIVVLDEPFGAFDPLQLREVFAAIRLVREDGAAVIASVHQLADAEKIADHFLILSAGKRLAWGDLDALRGEAERPGASLEEVFLALLTRSPHAA